MARYARNAAILAKIESSYGTDSSPSGAANAMLVSGLSITPLSAQNVSRDFVRTYMGNSPSIVGPAFVQCQFTVELAGAGTAGSSPAWGPVLRACGFAETVTTSSRVDYLPVSTSFESTTIYYHDDGLLHKIIGARGTFQLSAKVGERPTIQFSMTGLDGGVTATANPSLTLTAWQTPLAVANAYTGTMTVGGTYTTGTLGGGTGYASTGLEAALGASVNFIPLVGQETVEITDRKMTGKIMLDLTAAQEATFSTSVKAATLSGLGMTHGTAAGNTVVMYSPQAQLLNWSKGDVQGRRMIGYDVAFVPSTGNDEFRICVR